MIYFSIPQSFSLKKKTNYEAYLKKNHNSFKECLKKNVADKNDFKKMYKKKKNFVTRKMNEKSFSLSLPRARNSSRRSHF